MKFKTVFAAFLAFFCTFATAGFFDNMDIDGSKKNLEIYSQVKDKALVDHFYALSEDGKKASLQSDIEKESNFRFRKLTTGSITVRRQIFSANNLEMREFARTPQDDLMGRRYVEFAYSRGNTVRQFSPAMGEVFNRMFEQNLEFKPAHNVATFNKAENALIEYSPDEKIVSVMMRAHQAIHNLNTRSYQYVTIIFGTENGHFVENKLSNSFFSDTFQRVVVPDAKVGAQQVLQK